MTAQHTPGPWRVEDVSDGTAIVAADDERIAWLAWDDEWEPDQTVYERARLIAAAPDLLEALEYVNKGGRLLTTEALDRMHAAIRKARGEDA